MKDNKQEVGVIVGRFQLDKLHAGHLALIDHVIENHGKVIVFLGVSAGEHKEENALGYATREKMIKAAYPNVVVAPLRDMGNDKKWSNQLDGKVKEIYAHGSVVLYGGRESFLPHYEGRFDTCEFAAKFDVSATERRAEIKRTVRDSEDFRAGIIYNAANSYPNVFQCVDMAIIKRDTNEILLGRKPDEDLFRFPGGHVDTSDQSLEAAAKREAHEECGINLEFDEPQYVTSMLVDDWRYRDSKNKIQTALFTANHLFGNAQAADDIEEVKWFDIETLTHSDLKKLIVAEHIPLMLVLLNKHFKNTQHETV